MLGKDVAALAMAPRLGCMVLSNKDKQDAWLACLLAAMLEERDILHGEFNGSIESRIELLVGGKINRGGKRIMDIARRHAKQLGITPGTVDVHHAGLILATAFPDRIAMARDSKARRYLLSNGRGASLHEQENAQGSQFIVITDIADRSGDSRIFRFAQLDADDMAIIAGQLARQSEDVSWDEKTQRIVARTLTRLGAIELDSQRLETVSDEQAMPMLIDVIRKAGLNSLPWTDAARNLQARLQLATMLEKDWPDMSDQGLLGNLDQWLTPYLTGARSLSDITRLDLGAILKSQLNWNQQQWLDEMLPARITLPSGHHARIDYTHQPLPLMRSRVQDFFGLNQQPAVANGRVEVIIELLSPANRPVQRTQDLPGFWSGSYAEVRKEMKGRYPKHKWPLDPAGS